MKMDDDEIEQMLRRYRPADPPTDLLSTIHHVRDDRRTWPWAVAAAALLAIALGMHGGGAVNAGDNPSIEDARRQVAELSAALGDDPLARETATWLVRIERARRAAEKPE